MSIDLEHFPTSASAGRMLDSVTKGFYDKSYVGKWLFQVMGQEYDGAAAIVEELPDQFFPETATWGLRYHELKWGLPVQEGLSYDERRRLIFQKRDLKPPMSPCRMEEYLSGATGFEVLIADCNDPGGFDFGKIHPNTFYVGFQGEGTLDAGSAKTILNRLKQSHTTYLMYEKVSGYVRAPVEIRSGPFTLRSGFYPRENRIPLILDGTWPLDGRYLLGGYREGETVDFYPMVLTVRGRIPVFFLDKLPFAGIAVGYRMTAGLPEPPRSKVTLRVESGAGELIGETAGISVRTFVLEGIWEIPTALFRSESLAGPERKSGVCLKGGINVAVSEGGVMNTRFDVRQDTAQDVRTMLRSGAREKMGMKSLWSGLAAAAAQPETDAGILHRTALSAGPVGESGLTVEKDLWYLDGSVRLDGTRCLDAEIIRYDF